MTQNFEYKGYWFLPSAPENKIAGILKYTPNESLKLEIIGAFGKAESPIIAFTNSTSKDIIWGITSDAKKISLINCFPGGGSYNFSSTFPLIEYKIQYCLVGVFIQNFKDKLFNWSDIIIPELNSWCKPSALESIISFDEINEVNKISISFSENYIKDPIISVDLHNLTTLKLKQNVHFGTSNFFINPSFKQSTFLQIEKKHKSSFSDFLSDIHLFEEFLSLATLSTINVDSIILYDESNYQEISHERKIFHSIELIYVQEKVDSARTKEFDFLISFPEIKDILPNIIRRWFIDTIHIKPIRAHLIESVKNKTNFGSTDFLIVIQAIEGFCNRFRKEQSLTLELESLLKEFEDIEKVKKLEIDIKTVVDSRHYYSHFMHKSKKPNTLEGIGLYRLTKKLRIILICCLLNFIGIENIKINELLNKSSNDKLQSK